MAEPRVPGGRDQSIDAPCGETIEINDLDMGLREVRCRCGDDHAVVMDVHPLSRFVPEFLVEVLRQTVETADDFEEFTTAHLMGMVLQEFPEKVASADVSQEGTVGYSMVWVSDFDDRRLHEVVVELIVEMMEHAVSHAEDDTAISEFEKKMLEFDVQEFVEEYRAERDFEDEHDTAI